MNRRIVWFAVLLLVLAACSKAAPATSGGGGGAQGGSSAGGSSAGASAGPLTVEGSLTTSGAYDATWTWNPGDNVGLGDLGSITLTSDKGTFANIQVPRDGTISFGSGVVSEIGLNATGAGAQVTLDGQNMVVCSFTVDTDLTGAPGGALHLKGTLTIHGSDGVFSC